jgi:hypothetical protein
MKSIILYLLKEASLILNDKILVIIMCIFKLGYIPHLKKPRSLNEKINYLKLYNRNPLRCMITDRLKVREYVLTKCPEIKFSKIYWHGIDFDNNVWNSLPDKFVLKANHGSGMVKIVNKEIMTFTKIVPVIKKWLKLDYSRYGREWFYKNLDKFIIAEELLIENSYNFTPMDFKYFVLNGKATFVQVDINRFTNHKRNLYSEKFEKIKTLLLYPLGDDIEKPIAFDKAVSMAEQLAVDFDFIRVDLYLINDEIYFGELTNMPGNGFERFIPKAFDFEMGKKLPDKILR